MRVMTGVRLAAFLVATFVAADRATAQNDWQFPDPYFGAIEFEKSHPPGATRDPRRQSPSQPPAWIPAKRPRFFRPFRTRTQTPPPARPPRDAAAP